MVECRVIIAEGWGGWQGKVKWLKISFFVDTKHSDYAIKNYIVKRCHIHPTSHKKRTTQHRSFPISSRPLISFCILQSSRRTFFVSVNFFYSYSCHIHTFFAVRNSSTGVCESPKKSFYKRPKRSLSDSFALGLYFSIRSSNRILYPALIWGLGVISISSKNLLSMIKS